MYYGHTILSELNAQRYFLAMVILFSQKKTPNKEIDITEEKSQEQTKHTDTGAA